MRPTWDQGRWPWSPVVPFDIPLISRVKCSIIHHLDLGSVQRMSPDLRCTSKGDVPSPLDTPSSPHRRWRCSQSSPSTGLDALAGGHIMQWHDMPPPALQVSAAGRYTLLSFICRSPVGLSRGILLAQAHHKLPCASRAPPPRQPTDRLPLEVGPGRRAPGLFFHGPFPPITASPAGGAGQAAYGQSLRSTGNRRLVPSLLQTAALQPGIRQASRPFTSTQPGTPGCFQSAAPIPSAPLVATRALHGPLRS